MRIWTVILLSFFITAPTFAQPITVPGVGWEGQGAGVAITNLDGIPRPEMILMAYDNAPKDNTFRYRIGWNLKTSGVATSWGKPIIVPGVGREGQGAGVTIANLDINARPEMILLAYDNPPKDNTFRYKIGWNLNISGVAANWSNLITVPGAGWEGQGAGVTVTNLDGNVWPEIILLAYDNPAKDNTFRYKIGWNLNTSGVTTNWSNLITVPGVGWEGQGAGVAITNLDGNASPEMILMAYNNPLEDNTFRYKIGWNLNTSGVATNWGIFNTVPGVGWEGQGADMAVFNLNTDARPEYIFVAYDNPPKANTFRYRVVKNKAPAKRIHLEMDKLSGVNWPPTSVVRLYTKRWHKNFCLEGEIPAVGDFNGDGNDDIVTFLQADKAKGGKERGWIYVALSDGNKFVNTKPWHKNFSLEGEIPAIGDFNGDGKDDIVTFLQADKAGGGKERGWVYVAISDGSKFVNTKLWHKNFSLEGEIPAVGDFNGDGKDDIVTFLQAHKAGGGKKRAWVYVALSNGKNFVNTKPWHKNFSLEGEIPTVGDFNDDGKDDIITFLQADKAKGGKERGWVYVALSDGKNFVNTKPWDKNFSLEGEIPAVGDFNGEGKDDIANFLQADKAGGGKRRGWVYVAFSNGAHSLQSIYAVAGIDLSPVHNEGAISDIKKGKPYKDSELDAFRQAHMNNPGAAGTWHMYCSVLTRYVVNGVVGIMFDTNQRRAFAVFANEFTDSALYLRTTAHELGHALNLEHSDGDAWVPPNYPTKGHGLTIMNQTIDLATDWSYGWSASSLHHFYNHPESRWRPQSGITFLNCH